MIFTKKLKNYTGALAVSALMAGGATAAYAADVEVDATANFLQALALTKVNDMDFATIETSGAPAGADTAVLAIDDSITYTGAWTGGGTGTAGEVDITAGTDGATVEISCDTSGTLFGAGGTSNIAVNTIQVAMDGGAASACAGVGTATLTETLNLASNFKVLMGGTIDGGTAASFVNEAHSTANAGGTSITLDVLYQ